jgi:hypothetical protein
LQWRASQIKQKTWVRQTLFGGKIEHLDFIQTPAQLKLYVDTHESVIKSGGETKFEGNSLPKLSRKRRPRENGKNYFIKRIIRPNGGVSLLEYELSFDDKKYGASYRMTNYLVTSNKFRVFKYITEDYFTDSNYEKIMGFTDQIVKHLYARDGIPKESGVCINGGLIKDIPDMPKMWEKIDFALAYPYHSSEYELTMRVSVDMVSRPLTAYAKDREIYPIKRGRQVFRDKPLQLSGWAGREYALKTDGNIANAFGFPTYDFSWDGLGEINNSRNPHIFISLLVDGSQNRNKRDLQTVSTYPEFADKQGALAFWDKILSSVRTFPER